MTEATPSFFRRVSLAFAIVADREFATRVQTLRAAPPPAAAVVTEKPAAPPPLREAEPESALQLLGLLQREARFIDHLQEDIARYTDAEVGGAARIVHEGCRKVLQDSFAISPIRDEPEASPITLEQGFDAAAIRVTGNVVGEPPFHGSLAHRGWRVTETRLPKLANSHDAHPGAGGGGTMSPRRSRSEGRVGP